MPEINFFVTDNIKSLPRANRLFEQLKPFCEALAIHKSEKGHFISGSLIDEDQLQAFSEVNKIHVEFIKRP